MLKPNERSEKNRFVPQNPFFLCFVFVCFAFWQNSILYFFSIKHEPFYVKRSMRLF